MPDLASLLGVAAMAFGVGLSGAVMPGPLLAVTVSESVRRGPLTGPLIVLGHAVLESALVVAVTLGALRFLGDPRVTGAISFVGGGVMAWMGWGMLRSIRSLSLDAPAAPGLRLHPVAAGIVVSLSNPYWSLWWITIGLSYIVTGLRYGTAGVLAFFAGHILADLAWYSLVSVGVSRGRRFLTDSAYRALIGACGAGMIAFGAWFFRTGARVLGEAGP